jgi:hypothetical protein
MANCYPADALDSIPESAKEADAGAPAQFDGGSGAGSSPAIQAAGWPVREGLVGEVDGFGEA